MGGKHAATAERWSERWESYQAGRKAPTSGGTRADTSRPNGGRGPAVLHRREARPESLSQRAVHPVPADDRISSAANAVADAHHGIVDMGDRNRSVRDHSVGRLVLLGARSPIIAAAAGLAVGALIATVVMMIIVSLSLQNRADPVLDKPIVAAASVTQTTPGASSRPDRTNGTLSRVREDVREMHHEAI